MDELTTSTLPPAHQSVLYGVGTYDRELPGDKRQYWGMLHSLIERLVVAAASTDEGKAQAAKSTLAMWCKDLSNDVGAFARGDVDELVRKHMVAESAEDLLAWHRSSSR